jgi:hypothetical protein
MLSIRQYLHRRLTVRETVAVILILAGLAGAGYMAYSFICAKLLEARVNAALPKVCEGIRNQRRTLLSAIEAYKAHFGVYPPDHVVSRQPLVVDPVKNPLLYELAGVVLDPNKKVFELQGLEAADAKYVKEFFHCEGFTNCAAKVEQVKRFLAVGPLPAHQLHDDPDVFAVGFTELHNQELAPDVVWEFDITPWRYVSSSPTNNPDKFDLWIEVHTSGRSMMIGNWPAME